jgi:hypothetical protein
LLKSWLLGGIDDVIEDESEYNMVESLWLVGFWSCCSCCLMGVLEHVFGLFKIVDGCFGIVPGVLAVVVGCFVIETKGVESFKLDGLDENDFNGCPVTRLVTLPPPSPRNEELDDNRLDFKGVGVVVWLLL